MGLNKSKENIYEFVTHTWNVISVEQSFLKFDEKELKTDLGEDNFIFVGSSFDMFDDYIPSIWILKVLKHCENYPNNKYVFKSKNIKRVSYFYNKLKVVSGIFIYDTTNEEKSKKDFKIRS